MRTLAVTLALALVVALSAAPPARFAARDIEGPTTPFLMRDDFQGDGLGQWASYPPAQDVGYEPSLTPTRQFDARGGRSLMRVVRPTSAGPLRIGFIKHVPFVAGPGARLSFAYRLEAPGAAAAIETSLAGSSGRLYTARSQTVIGSWTDVALAASDFRAGGAPLGDRERDRRHLRCRDHRAHEPGRHVPIPTR